jgi:hypothetical protein
MARKKIMPYAESAFDIAYLCAVLIMGCFMLFSAKSEDQFLYGIMTLTLVTGDAFHLIPRIASVLSRTPERFYRMLGIGKMAASVGMTLFYVILWHIGVLLFSVPGASGWTVLAYVLAAARIFLSVLPQNKWSGDGQSHLWGIYRNIPFILLGAMVGLLFFFNRDAGIPQLRWLWLAPLGSFAFYLPVVFGAYKYPWLGMLMLPKSCFYVWIVTMGL